MNSVKRQVYFCIMAFSSMYGLTQTKSIDSLKLLLNKVQQTTSRLDLMKEIGTQLVENGFYNDGLNWYFNALKLAEARRDTTSMAALCNNIAVIYTETDQNKRSYPFAEKAVQYALRRNDDKLKANAYNTLGNVYYADYQDSIALGHFNSSLEYRIRSADTAAIGTALKNLAGVYNEFGDHRKALQLTHMARVFRLIKGNADQKMSLFVTLSDLQFGIKQYDSAFYYLSKASEYLRASKNLYELKSYYNSSIQVHRQRNDLEKVISDMNSVLRIKDSILDQESQKNMSELQTRYETEKKDSQLKIQKLELETKEQEALYSKILFVGIVTIILLLFSFFFIRFKSRQKLKDEVNRIEKENVKKRVELETKEKERNRISAELHDNVGSSVSFISSKIDWLIKNYSFNKLEKEELMFLKDSSQDVMNRLRETLWTLNNKNISNVDLCDKLKVYLRKYILCTLKITDSISSEYILANEDVLAIYRCAQEIANNINKHSKAQSVRIDFYSDEKTKLKISFHDDGVGFEEEKKEDNYGLRNIRNRLKHIGAKLEINSVKGSGTSVTIIYI
ncbi:MAG: hypothetical protein IPM51_00675 [Sphingobacteriaceae bacterium]|nr:hypothetical protein [Sphingobacteriaceae bacterium]